MYLTSGDLILSHLGSWNSAFFFSLQNQWRCHHQNTDPCLAFKWKIYTKNPEISFHCKGDSVLLLCTDKLETYNLPNYINLPGE